MFEDDHFNEPENINAHIRKFEEMLKHDKQYFFDVDDFEGMVDYYIEGNNPNKALEVIDFATSQHPYSSVFLLRKAQLLSAINKPQKALEILSRVEAIEPANIEVYISKGH